MKIKETYIHHLQLFDSDKTIASAENIFPGVLVRHVDDTSSIGTVIRVHSIRIGHQLADVIWIKFEDPWDDLIYPKMNIVNSPIKL